MFKYLLALMTTVTLFAGVMDFQTISNAQDAYRKGQYEKAAELFSSVANKNDEARYDYANALYKSKQYASSIPEYKKISDKSILKAQALYNAGNAHAQLGQLDQAEQAYKNALKIAQDPGLKADIEHNLEVIKQERKKDKDQQKDQNKKSSDKDQEKNGNDQDQQKNQNDQKQNSNDQNQQNENSDSKQQSNPKEGENSSGQPQQGHSSSHSEMEQQKEAQGAAQSSESRENEEESQAAQGEAKMAEPISDMEERKYNKILDKRGIKTLMIPLESKGEPRNDETTPW